MKKNQTGRKALCLILALLMALSLVACGGTGDSSAAGAQTGTGTAKGFGGDVTVTITVEGGKITAATAEGPDETEGWAARPSSSCPSRWWTARPWRWTR